MGGRHKRVGLVGGLLLTSLSTIALAAPSVGGNDIKSADVIPAKTATVENSQIQPSNQSPAVAFNVKAITVHSDVSLNPAQVQQMTSAYVNRNITLEDLNKLADAVTYYYRTHGYPAAAAFVPVQKAVMGGVLQLQVVTGRFGAIQLDNQSRVREGLLQGLLQPLKIGDGVRSKKLETALYNINNVGGITASGILSPGREPGTSDLTVRVANDKRDTFLVYANNYGSTAAGRYRYGLQGDYYDIGPRGGHATFGGFISNKNQHNYNLGYSAMVGNGGTRLGLAFSRTDYELGDAFRDLDATGVANTYSFYGATPLWNTWQRSLQLVYGYDYRDMREELRSAGYDVKKHAHTVHLGLTGHERNGKSYLGYALTGYLGTLGIDHDAYNMTGRPEGRFSKGVLDALWIQGFNKKWDFLVKVEGQQSATDLDNSEEIYLGGPSAVRAYPQGEGSGDTGYQATAELRYHTSLPGLVLSTYFDGGHVNQKNDNSGTTLKGWGIGVTYAKTNDWYARFDYARRIGLGNNVSTEAEDHGRMWFMLGKIF